MEALAHKIVTVFFNLAEIIGFLSACFAGLIVGGAVLFLGVQIILLFLRFFQS